MNQFLSFFLFRVLLPIFFVAAFAFRFNGISCIYLLLFLISPLLATPSNASLAGHTGCYLKALTGLCVLLALGHVIFQIVLLSTPPYGHYLFNCKELEVILRHVGFVRYDSLNYLGVARYILPEILMLIISISLLVVFRKKSDVEIVSEPPAQAPTTNLPVASILRPKIKKTAIAVAINIFVDLLLLAAASVARPSITSSVYLLLFLGIATWVACYKNLGKKFAVLRIFLMIFTAVHILILYLYQFQIMQDLIPSDNLYIRLFGLTKLVITDCDDPRVLHFENLEWASFANPGVLCLLYWVLAIQTRSFFATKLLASDSGSRTYQTVGPEEDGLEIDPNGSAIWSSSHPSEGQQEAEAAPPEDRFKTLKNWLSPIVTIAQLVTRQSYIATLIIMMAWSITYHSWLTFILLLWSCILWMMPNSRIACWKSSPFLVAYAEALIIIQYVYSLNLTDSELPRTIDTVNLAQIGLNKVLYLGCIPLSIKILYTVMFWITLRQYMQEKYQDRNKDIAEGVMMRPVNMAYATAQSAEQSQPDLQRQPSVSQGNKLMKKLGEFVLSLLTKYFIWLVALMLMLNALGGEEVVVFRIIYMALFLFFILMFQLSYKLWRKIMYGFWLTVIMYSMTLLILIYTYQFEYFPHYWTKYLHISEDLQRDIGLEVYDTGGLFLNLLRATFFVVITIIQLHYFHKDFLRISDIDKVEDETNETSIIVAIGSEAETNVMQQDVAPLEAGEEFPISDSQISDVDEAESNVAKTKHKSSFKAICIELGKKALKVGFHVYDLVSDFCWRYLEIHIIKIVLFSVLLLALYDVCAVHFVFVMFVIIATPVRKIQGFISHCCALWASILLISKMIYQIDYIQEYWIVNCTDVDLHINRTVNNAHWMGFQKVNELPSYLKGYLGLIFVLTIQAVIKVRMRHHRVVMNEVEPEFGIMYPEIERKHADLGLIKCAKYLINFGFYKFGVEICLMTITAGIGVRLDLFAVIYAIVLATLFLLRRRTLAKIWPFYVTFLAIIIPVQYLMCVGLPPGLCIGYVYEESMHSELREWLFLPDYVKPPEAYKLTVDFFLLLFACCQLYAFSIETSPRADSYQGGSNKEIIYLPDYPHNNPIFDYVTSTKSYLDLVKVGIFFSLYWVTLAIFFLAGTNRVSLFAMGYVIGCFLFLWNGQEFFLKPISYILKWWNVLLGYTVAVICIKSILQLIGCVFLHDLYANFCWLIQLFSIACLKKFEKSVQQSLIPSSVADDCQVPVDEAGLLWDGICLAFLLLQKRFFCSYYFPHLVTEMRAQAALANRGAELINQMLMKEVLEQQAAEKEIVEKIKNKMDKIRMHQQKIRGTEYVEPDSHYSAIRSGDYDLFDDFSDDEGLVELEYGATKKAKEKDEQEQEEVPVKGIPVSKLLASAMKTDIKHAVNAAQKAKGIESDSEPTTSGPSDRSGKTPVSRTVSGGSQVSFALSHRDSLSPHDIPRRPQTLPTLHPVEDGRDQPSAGADTSDQVPSEELGERRARDDGEPPGDGEKLPGDGDEYGVTKDESSEESFGQKIHSFLRFLWVFIEGLMVSATAKLNLISRDYRYVARSLSKEKKALKEKWLKGEKDSKDVPISVDISSSEKLTAPDDTLQIRVEKASEDRTDDSFVDETIDPQKEFEAEQPPIVRLLVAIWYAVVSRSEIVCYIMIVVNQIKSASILSLPLPFMAFLWGTLSIPRPSKSFWITIITYTEAVVVIKYMFQFGFFPWNQETRPVNQPFWAPRILGIEKKEQYAVYDLALLLVVFFHRFILKSLGLWKDTSKSDIDSSLSTEVKDTSHMEHSESSERSNERKSSFSVSQKEQVVTEIVDPTGGGTLLLGFLQYVQPIRSFMYNLLNPPYRVTKDVYAYMFICDFITFLIVVFGYWAFGTGGGEGVASYFEEDKVPVPFLIMLIAQFGLIVVDRALFLRKYIVGKLIFQIVIVFVVHLWMFFILPVVTERKFNSNLPPQLWYFVKCMYLLLSAYQIRSGYPTRILGNFLTKKYNYLNLILFKGFMAVPFLFELRALMDWIWTDTSMAIGSWLKMEDIFVHIFVTKCNRRAEAEYPVARGTNRKAVVKYGVGGTLLFIIILLIWFPLVLFALGNTVGLPNPPIGSTIEVSFSGFEPIFKISAQYSDLKQFTEKQYETFRYQMRTNPSAQTFLSNFDYWDIYVAQLSGSSTSFWTISPPSVKKLEQDLISDNDITMRFAWQFTHATTGKDTEPVVGDDYVKVLRKDDPARKQLAEMIQIMSVSGPRTSPVTITNIMPKFIRVPSKGKAAPVKAFLPDNKYYSNITLALEKGAYKSTNDSKFWWVIREDCQNNPYKWLPYTADTCNEDKLKPNEEVTLVSFNDKVFPATLSVLSGYGIIGLYTTLVLVASRFVRGIVAGVSYTIMFDDLPCVDRVLQLCLDIYLVRESGELKLEEDLFAKLVFLYRSPETLIKWTRYPHVAQQQEAN